MDARRCGPSSEHHSESEERQEEQAREPHVPHHQRDDENARDRKQEIHARHTSPRVMASIFGRTATLPPLGAAWPPLPGLGERWALAALLAGTGVGAVRAHRKRETSPYALPEAAATTGAGRIAPGIRLEGP